MAYNLNNKDYIKLLENNGGKLSKKLQKKYNNDIIVFNGGAVVTSSVDVECFRVPIPVNWSYVVVNEKALYNANAAVDFELHRSEEDTLVYKILELAGIVMNNTGLTTTVSQLAAGEQQFQNQ